MFSPYFVTTPFGLGVVDAAHREVHAALAVGGQIVDDAADAVERIALIPVGQDLALRRELRDAGAQAALDDEQRALRVHRQRAAGVRVGVDDRRLAVLIQLQDLAVVVLRQQQPAVVGADDAVAVVADLLPEELPLLAGGDHAREWRRPCSPDARRWRRRAGAAPRTAARRVRRAAGGGVLHVAISAA